MTQYRAADAIGVQGRGNADPDCTIAPGRCECGGQTWPMEENAYWQCEDCGTCYNDRGEMAEVVGTTDQFEIRLDGTPVQRIAGADYGSWDEAFGAAKAEACTVWIQAREDRGNDPCVTVELFENNRWTETEWTVPPQDAWETA